MLDKEIMGKSMTQWKAEYPIMKHIAAVEETTWINPERLPAKKAVAQCPLTMAGVQEASDRLGRFSDYFKVAFPKTQVQDRAIGDIMAVIVGLREEAALLGASGKLRGI